MTRGYGRKSAGDANTRPMTDSFDEHASRMRFVTVMTQRGCIATDKTTVRFPDENSWALGDRSVTCIASSDLPRTGSIRDAK
jgi:hypothetical protein